MKKYLSLAVILGLTLSQAEETEKKDGERPRAGSEQRDRDNRPQRPRGGEQPKFEDIDADSSGGVSKEEWIAHQVKMAEERAERSFGFVDRDESGDLSKEEIAAAIQRMRGAGGGKGGARPQGGRKGGPDKGQPKGGEKKRPALEE